MSLVLELVRPNNAGSSSAFTNEKALQIRVKENASAALRMIHSRSSQKTAVTPTYKVLS